MFSNVRREDRARADQSGEQRPRDGGVKPDRPILHLREVLIVLFGSARRVGALRGIQARSRSITTPESERFLRNFPPYSFQEYYPIGE